MKFIRIAVLAALTASLVGCGGGGIKGAQNNGPLYLISSYAGNIIVLGPGTTFVREDTTTNKYYYHTGLNDAGVEITSPVAPKGILPNNLVYWLEGTAVKVWAPNGNISTTAMPDGLVPYKYQADGRAYCVDPADDNKAYVVLNGAKTLLGKPRAGAELQLSQYVVPQNRSVVNTTDGTDNVVMVYDTNSWRQLADNYIALNSDDEGRIYGYATTNNRATVYFSTFTPVTYPDLDGHSGSYALTIPSSGVTIGASLGGPNGATLVEWRNGVAAAVDTQVVTANHVQQSIIADGKRCAVVYLDTVANTYLTVIVSPP